MNMPKNCRTRPSKTGSSIPILLGAENLWRHEAAAGLKTPVVMCDGSYVVGGHDAGDHDGLRDGYSPGVRKFFRVYASLEDWLAAGNPDPRS